MPIVPPGSIYSPGDDLFNIFSSIGSSIPRILDPRRDTRGRAMDIMNDPEKLKPIVSRIYASSLVSDGRGGVVIDEIIYDEGVRAFAVSLGLRPDNAQEFAVIRPIIDAAVAALPADVKVKLETGVSTKGLAAERELQAKETQAGISGFDVERLENKNKIAFVRASLALGTSVKTAQVQYDALLNEERLVDFQQGFMTGLQETGAQDTTLANLIAVGDRAAIAQYLAELKLQALRIEAAIKKGGVKGITPQARRAYRSTRHAELTEARDNIREIEELEGSNEVALRSAIDAYNQVNQNFKDANEAFGVRSESFTSTPSFVWKRPLGRGFLRTAGVEWAHQTIAPMPGVSAAETQSLNEQVAVMFAEDPFTVDAKLTADYANPASELRLILDATTYQAGRDFISHIGIQGERRLPNFLAAYKAHRAPPPNPFIEFVEKAGAGITGAGGGFGRPAQPDQTNE